MNLDKYNKQITIKNEKQIKILLLVIILRHIMTYLFDVTEYIKSRELTIAVECLIYFLLMLPAFFAYKKIGIHKETIDLKNKKQYIYGILLVIPLVLAMCFVFDKPLKDLFSKDEDIYVIRDTDNFLWIFIFYMFVVALTEEMCYRLYIQGEMATLMGKVSFLAPLITSIPFGYMHIVQGFVPQAYFAFLMGLILGYAKQYIKDCTFISVVIAHGLYDFFAIYFVW